MSSEWFRCLVLGEEPLAIHCAAELIERGHTVIGLVTTAPALARWAREHGVPVIEPAAYPARLASEPVDLLCSITHPARIAPQALAQARVAAINFHDGPLPRYAGMNASAWAIANGESHHAIVWHHMTADLDAGDILERRDLELDARETSHSLNIRNVALALESFRVLLERLERGDGAGMPQPRNLAPASAGDVADRRFYSRHDRPPALCTIDWTATAQQIDRLVRACEFGNHANAFGLTKVAHHDAAVGARESWVLPPAAPIETSSLPPVPGTLLAIEDAHLEIACGGGRVRLGQFVSLTGVSMSAREAARTLGVRPGELLRDSLRPARASLTRTIAEAEPQFLGDLRALIVPELPSSVLAGAPACPSPAPPPFPVDPPATSPRPPDEAESGAVGVFLPPAFRVRFAGDLVAACAALYGFIWSCLLLQDVFDIALVDGDARGPLAAAAALLFPAVPLRIRIEPGLGFDALVAALAVRWRQREQRRAGVGGFLADLVARHPDLPARQELRRGSLSPLAIVVGHGTAATPSPSPPGAALTLRIRDGGHRLALLADGPADPAFVAAFARHLVHVATVVADDADQPLAEISLLDGVQYARQVMAWNDTARPFPDSDRLNDGFERVVDRRPHDIALVCDGHSLTFAEVERRANRIAHALQARGARPGTYVALMMERGFDLVCGMLGIAKSGAAYVPIDATFPADRARLMLADAGCVLALASPSLTANVPGICTVLTVDDAEIVSAPEHRPHAPGQAARAIDVCYAIYTSGSTGTPKGVVLTHRAVVNTLDWFNRTFDVGPADRLLFVTSPSFDLSAYDMFGALGAGASVEIALPALLSDPAALARRLCEPGITIWDSAPPALARLVPFLSEVAPEATLRLVQLSGDWIPVSLPGALRRVFPGVEVNSLGGATEAAIWSNHYAIDAATAAATLATWRSIPYGTPIQNARYYVLDHHLRPMPVGIPGELFIGGVCLAEGYLNRPQLTAERFLPDPFRPGERIYRTGDLARYDGDGVLELLGRADHQVKIRGFRVELGEIEAAIHASGLVREAVVVAAVVDASEQKSLVAYVVPHGFPQARADWQPTALRNLLARQLPEFMVPSHVVALDALPLSSSGKVDRRALPDAVALTQSGPVTPPRTALEQRLVALWEELLRKKPIGIHDDFFALGGHSLLATLLVTRIANRLGVDVPLSQVVSGPTIARLAQLIEARRADPERRNQYIQLMNQPGNGTPLYMTSGVGGHVFIFQEVAELLSGQHAIHGIRAVGADGECEPRDNLREVAEIYVRELTQRPPGRPIALGGYSLGAPVAFELAHQLRDHGIPVLGLIFVDGFAPGYPRKLPLGARLASHLTELRSAPRGERAAVVRNRAERLLSRLGEKVGLPLFVGRNIGVHPDDEELVRAMDPRLRGQLTHLWMKMHAAGDAYRIARPLSLPVLLLKSATPFVGTSDDLTNGWAASINGPIDVVRLPGDHDAMIRSPAMRGIATEIQSWLAFQEGGGPYRGRGRGRAARERTDVPVAQPVPLALAVPLAARPGASATILPPSVPSASVGPAGGLRSR